MATAKVWRGDYVRVTGGPHAGKEGVVVKKDQQGGYIPYTYVWIRVKKSPVPFHQMSGGLKIHIRYIELVEMSKYRKDEMRRWEKRMIARAKKPTKIRYPIEEENDSQTNDDQ